MLPQITNFRLGIGIVNTQNTVYSDFFDTFITMKKPSFVYMRERGDTGQLDKLRNNIVKRARRERCSHLLMLDCDQTMPEDLIPQLLSHELMIVGALVHRRYQPFDPLMCNGEIGHFMTIDNEGRKELVEVDTTGTGCLLFDMRVFDAIPEPWFKFTDPRDVPQLLESYPWLEEENIKGIIGEDFWFCWQAKQAGFRIYVDTSVPCGHLSLMEVSYGTYDLYKALKEVQLKKMQKLKEGG